MSTFKVTWDRPMHLDTNSGIYRGGPEYLPEADSRETAIAIIKTELWQKWLRGGKMTNIILHEQEQNDAYAEYLIEIPISLE